LQSSFEKSDGGDDKEEMNKNLYDAAFLVFTLSSEKCGTGGMFKDFSDAVVHLGGTFKVPLGANLAGNCFSL